MRTLQERIDRKAKQYFQKRKYSTFDECVKKATDFFIKKEAATKEAGFSYEYVRLACTERIIEETEKAVLLRFLNNKILRKIITTGQYNDESINKMKADTSNSICLWMPKSVFLIKNNGFFATRLYAKKENLITFENL